MCATFLADPCNTLTRQLIELDPKPKTTIFFHCRHK